LYVNTTKNYGINEYVDYTATRSTVGWLGQNAISNIDNWPIYLIFLTCENIINTDGKDILLWF